MVCAFGVSVEVVNVAWPVESRTPVPIVVDPSLNVTVPVGTPENCGFTVAVNLTEAFKVDGLADDVTSTELVA